MKKTFAFPFAILLSTTLASQAALIQFELSPAGTDVAVGLSPSNEVPAAVTSGGSGNAISGGIVFDTDTSVLQLAVGYGTAAGFTDLTGAATAMHIHGPAGAGTNAPPVVDLAPYHFPAADPTKGGLVFGNILIPTNVAPMLLARLTYLNIHTATYAGGEIRGQLIPLLTNDLPPSVTCPAASTVQCGAPAELTAAVSDPDGDAMTVIWTVNGVALQTNAVPASQPPAPADVVFSASLPTGTNLVEVTVTDDAANTASCSTTVTVVDSTAPTIRAASASPSVLWPANHKMVTVNVVARVVDACGPTTWKITGVTSNEAVNGNGDGNTSPDWLITGDHAVQLRAERAGNGKGRVYSITIQAEDDSGNVSRSKVLTVTVPHSQGKN